MSVTAAPPTDRELRELLGGDDVVELSRRPYRYATSAPLEELRVRFADGRKRRLILKDASRERLMGDARDSKPAFLYEHRRELVTYRRLLAPAGIGPRLYGVDAARGWLVIEKVPGVELWQVGEFEVWEGVAAWVAGLHARFAGRERELRAANPHLIEHSEAWFLGWRERALAALAGSGDPRAPELARALERYDEVARSLAALPRTLLHGELYPSNVMVVRGDGGLRVCPVDWEMAAIGPAAVDLAALVAGWSDAERDLLVRAYARSDGNGPLEALVADLDRGRLHFALQWLGWSADWRPPPEHVHDWVDEALSLTCSLRLA